MVLSLTICYHGPITLLWHHLPTLLNLSETTYHSFACLCPSQQRKRNLMMAENKKLWPEPVPDWPRAKEIWKWGWPFHIYFFTVLYCLVVIRGLYILIRQGKQELFRRSHRFLMNALLLVFGISRTVFLIWNPYGSGTNESKAELVACIITLSIGTACITAAISFLLLIVLESTRISVAPSKVQNRAFLLAVFVINVLYIIMSDLIVAHFHEAKVMILICQVAFALWGILVALGYALAAARLWRNFKSTRQSAQYNPDLAADGKKFTKLVILLYLASFCGMVMFCTIVYSALGDTGVYNETGIVSNWPWIAVQTLMRSCETFMCLLIFCIALKTNTGSTTKNNKVDCVESKAWSVKSRGQKR